VGSKRSGCPTGSSLTPGGSSPTSTRSDWEIRLDGVPVPPREVRINGVAVATWTGARRSPSVRQADDYGLSAVAARMTMRTGTEGWIDGAVKAEADDAAVERMPGSIRSRSSEY
jgi:hypothetical protein